MIEVKLKTGEVLKLKPTMSKIIKIEEYFNETIVNICINSKNISELKLKQLKEVFMIILEDEEEKFNALINDGLKRVYDTLYEYFSEFLGEEEEKKSTEKQ